MTFTQTEKDLMFQRCIAVDFDGTLATYDRWRGAGHCGDPIPRMVERVKRWLEQGEDVKIFTARVSIPDQAEEAKVAITLWCEEHLGQPLEVTCIKLPGMDVIFDDRAVNVSKNKGEIMQTYFNVDYGIDI